MSLSSVILSLQVEVGLSSSDGFQVTFVFTVTGLHTKRALDGDFWWGNKKIHALTSSGKYEIRVDLKYKRKSLSMVKITMCSD